MTGFKTLKVTLEYASSYYCNTDITVTSNTITMATLCGVSSGFNIDDIKEIRCQYTSSTNVRITALSSGSFTSNINVQVYVLVLPINLNL